MLTQLFKPEDSRRETAFLWNYAGMNLGFFLGFSMSGYFQLTQNYVTLFLLSSLGNILALLILFYFWSHLDDVNTRFVQKSKAEQRRSSLIGLTMVLLLPWVLMHLLHNADIANKLVLVTGVLMIIAIVYMAYQQPVRRDRDRMLAFAALVVVSTVFWVLSQLAPMGLTHFIDNNVERQWGNWLIPPQWFQNINTLTIIVGGPLLGWTLNRLRALGYQINIPAQFSIALLCAGIAMIILPIAIDRANAAGLISPGWIVLTYFLQSIGELLINPIGYAMIGFLAPAHLQGAMMGMWMLNIGVGSTLASYCSNWMTAGQSSVNPLLTNEGYSDVFMILGWITLAAGIVLYLLVPRLRVLMQEVPAEQRDQLAVV
jgi:POT family proton-dependent oligopeptide transporter